MVEQPLNPEHVLTGIDERIVGDRTIKAEEGPIIGDEEE